MKFILSFVLSIFTVSVYAQNYSGQVIDTKTKEALMGVTIAIDNGAMGVVTDFDGKFNIPNIAQGNHNVKITYVGYVTIEKSISISSNNINENIEMSETSQELNLVVVSASKYARDVREETVSMEVIPKQFITNNNPTSMDGAMNRVPGVNIIDGQANIRSGAGFTYGAGSRVQILIDGLPLTTADAGDTKWDFMPIENIEQVEVIKGAASALYGSSAMNGIINIRTAYPTSTPETKVSMFRTMYENPADKKQAWWLDSTGTNNLNYIPFETGVSFSHKQKFDQLDLVLGGNYFAQNGFRQSTESNRGRFNINTRYRFKNIEGLAIGVNTNIQNGISGTFFIWDNDSSGAYKPSSLGSNTSNLNKSTRMTIDPFLDKFFKNGSKFSIRSRWFNARNDNNTQQSSLPNLYYGEGQFFYPEKHTGINFIVGTSGYYSDVKSILYGNHYGKNFSGFVQLDKRFDKSRTSISGGWRYEFFKIDSTRGQSKPVYRLGLSQAVGKATFLRASWGQGYRFPSIAEKYISTNVGGLVIISNPELVAETGWSAELGLKQGVRIMEWESLIDMAVYYQEYTNMMEFNFVYNRLGFQSQNLLGSRVAGFEISGIGQGRIGSVKLQYLGGFTYSLPSNKYSIVESFNNTMDTVEIPLKTYFQQLTSNILKTDSAALENILYFRNLRTLKFDIQASYSKFTLGLGMQYLSLMEKINPELELFVAGIKQYKLDHKKGDLVLEARFQVEATKNVSFNFICKNALNRFYYIRPALAEGPRNYTLQVNFKF